VVCNVVTCESQADEQEKTKKTEIGWVLTTRTPRYLRFLLFKSVLIPNEKIGTKGNEENKDLPWTGLTRFPGFGSRKNRANPV